MKQYGVRFVCNNCNHVHDGSVRAPEIGEAFLAVLKSGECRSFSIFELGDKLPEGDVALMYEEKGRVQAAVFRGDDRQAVDEAVFEFGETKRIVAVVRASSAAYCAQ